MLHRVSDRPGKLVIKKHVMIKLIIIVIFSIMPAVVTGGCWNNRDLTELAIAVAVGFDRAPGGDIIFTAQIVKPGVLKARQQGSAEEAFWTYSAGGETPFSAIRNMLTTLDRKTYFSHVQLIVIGEELAREGIMEALDLFERDQETNRQAYVLISRGITASKILGKSSDLEDIPGLQLVSIIENNAGLAKIKEMVFFDLLKCLNAPGFSPAVGVIQPREGVEEVKKIRDLKIEGAAVFQKDRLVGWLDNFATRGLLFALDEVEGGIINVPNPLVQDKLLGFEITGSRGRIDARLEEGKPLLIVEVKAKGRVGTQAGPDVSTADRLEQVGKMIAGVIEEDINRAVRAAQQEYGSDIFDFAGKVHQKYPRYWQEVSGEWTRVFSSSPVEVKVNWDSSSTGLIKEPSRAR